MKNPRNGIPFRGFFTFLRPRHILKESFLFGGVPWENILERMAFAVEWETC